MSAGGSELAAMLFAVCTVVGLLGWLLWVWIVDGEAAEKLRFLVGVAVVMTIVGAVGARAERLQREDVNADGQVDKLDVLEVRAWVGQPGGVPRYDIDRDGRVTMIDVRLVVLACTYPACSLSP